MVLSIGPVHREIAKGLVTLHVRFYFYIEMVLPRYRYIYLAIQLPLVNCDHNLLDFRVQNFLGPSRTQKQTPNRKFTQSKMDP
jgi:hypothetical protein